MLVATVFLVMALVAIGAAAGLGARGIGWKLAILPLFQSLGVVGLGVGLSIGRPIGAAIGVFLALLGTVATVVSYRRWLETPLGELERVMVSLQRGEAASLSEAARFKPFAGISDRLASLLRRQEEVIALLDGMTVYDLSHRVTPGGPHDRLAAAAAKSLEARKATVLNVGTLSDRMSSSASQTKQEIEAVVEGMLRIRSSSERLAKGIPAMEENVESTVVAVEAMVDRTGHIASSADDLSGKVSVVSSSIIEMATSVEQVANTVAEISEVSRQGAETAGVGRQAVSRTVEGMERINQVMEAIMAVIERLGGSSEQIGTIVEVIGDIAEQTNLLALNAAIEAARAGEAGRGFAVVADEVRKLAERSRSATGEITNLIRGIQREAGTAVQTTREGSSAIQDGIVIAKEAGESLVQIVRTVQQSYDLIEQIRLATGEQAKTAAHIKQEVEGMNTLASSMAESAHGQRKNGDRVVGAMDAMVAGVQEVKSALQDQQVQGAPITSGIERVRAIALENYQSSQEFGATFDRIIQAVRSSTGEAGPTEPRAPQRLLVDAAH
jgi:methyl-accepting chemotaxis protein